MAHHHWINLRAARLLDREIELHLKLGVTLAKLGAFIRYQTAAERSFHKAHTELLKAKKQRQDSKIGFESKKPEVTSEAPPKQEPKIPFPTPAEPQEPNLRQEIAWIMSVTPRRIAGEHPLKSEKSCPTALDRHVQSDRCVHLPVAFLIHVHSRPFAANNSCVSRSK